jgi:hypothetical protein
MHGPCRFGYTARRLKSHRELVEPLASRQRGQSEKGMASLIYREKPCGYGLVSGNSPELIDPVAWDLGQAGGQEEAGARGGIPQQLGAGAGACRHG